MGCHPRNGFHCLHLSYVFAPSQCFDCSSVPQDEASDTSHSDMSNRDKVEFGYSGRAHSQWLHERYGRCLWERSLTSAGKTQDSLRRQEGSIDLEVNTGQ